MSFGTFCAILFLMVIAYFLILSLKGVRPVPFIDDEDEVTVTTTTTTTTEEPPVQNVVGNLKRELDGIQAFVIDPVDQQKIWLNSNDDMYEDADGKFWRLI